MRSVKMATGAEIAQHSVLIVEDERDLNETVARFLRRRGFCVEQAYESAGALNAITSRDHALVIVDIRLGGESGVAMLNTAAECGFKPPVLLVSGDDCLLAEADTERLNILRVLNKPVHLRLLADFLAKFMARAD